MEWRHYLDLIIIILSLHRHNYLAWFWAMTSFLKLLTHAKNTDNHFWSAFMQYFECMVRKTFIIYSCFLCLRNKKNKFSNFSYPGSRKDMPSAKIMISGQKCCRHLIDDGLKHLCAQFGYDWTRNKDNL